MSRIFSNGPHGDYIINPFNRLMHVASRLYLACPYFTHAEPLRRAATDGKSIRLLVGLNTATSPSALREVHEVPGIQIRYLTHRFHAKVYIFDSAALLGSANLTDSGLTANREAVICLDPTEDADAVEDLRALFHELWNSGQVPDQREAGQICASSWQRATTDH